MGTEGLGLLQEHAQRDDDSPECLAARAAIDRINDLETKLNDAAGLAAKVLIGRLQACFTFGPPRPELGFGYLNADNTPRLVPLWRVIDILEGTP